MEDTRERREKEGIISTTRKRKRIDWVTWLTAFPSTLLSPPCFSLFQFHFKKVNTKNKKCKKYFFSNKIKQYLFI